jgi:hypothetical protein
MRSRFHIWAENMLLSGLSLGKILVQSPCPHTLPKSKKQAETCVILANGPSLNASVGHYEDRLLDYDRIAVNLYPSTPLFQSLPPHYLVVAAPEFFIPNVLDSYKVMAENFFTDLVENTLQPLHLFFPKLAARYPEWQTKLAANPHISWSFFNSTPSEGFITLIDWAISSRRGMPRPHNVLIPSLVLALQMGYRQIYVMGADHSWLKDLWVNDANRVMLKQKHFYDEETAQAAPMYKLGKTERHLHEVLEKFYLSFKAYHSLRDYAERRGVSIINLTPNSYIDAFQRQDHLP